MDNKPTEIIDTSDGTVVGKKNDAGKPRFDLIPPAALFELARLYEMGARKYDDNNWRKGMTWGRVFAAMMRHAWYWWSGEKHDQIDGQHHLASVVWCAITLMSYEVIHPEGDDRATKDSNGY